MSPDLASPRAIAAHYTRPDLLGSILAAVRSAGKDPDALALEDLASVDEFHIRGREATLELAQDAGLGPGIRVLDVGSGIGGPSRRLAHTFGCEVEGVDLTEDLCRVAQALAERTGLAGAVRYRQGDACALPYGEASFDVVWTQHVAMNIADKPKLYGEMARVLRPGGTLALYDVIAAGPEPIHLPVPWAREAGASHLVSAEGLRRLLEDAGCRVHSWKDRTPESIRWIQAVASRTEAQGPPPVGLHLMLGEDFPAMFGNMGRNLEEGRIATVQVVAVKAGGSTLDP